MDIKEFEKKMFYFSITYFQKHLLPPKKNVSAYDLEWLYYNIGMILYYIARCIYFIVSYMIYNIYHKPIFYNYIIYKIL